MKRIFFAWLGVFFFAITTVNTNVCFADRLLVDQLFSSAPVIDSDSKEKSQEDADMEEGEAVNPLDPFAAERVIALKGKVASDLKKTNPAATDAKASADQAAKASGKDQKADAGSTEKKSAGGNSKKQPSMYYYQ